MTRLDADHELESVRPNGTGGESGANATAPIEPPPLPRLMRGRKNKRQRAAAREGGCVRVKFYFSFTTRKLKNVSPYCVFSLGTPHRLCKGGCAGLSCSYPTMCQFMVKQYTCECESCRDCDSLMAPPAAATPAGKEFFQRRVVGGGSTPETSPRKRRGQKTRD